MIDESLILQELKSVLKERLEELEEKLEKL